MTSYTPWAPEFRPARNVWGVSCNLMARPCWHSGARPSGPIEVQRRWFVQNLEAVAFDDQDDAQAFADRANRGEEKES